MKQRTPKLLDSEGLWSYALRVLGGRAHSSGELREKLKRKAERADDIDPILARLKDIGYLDDRRFAESFATARLSNDKLGRTRVVMDLRRRRVAPPVAQTTVEKVYEGVDEMALIEEWIRRKYRMTAREGLFASEKDLGSAYRRLLRAGFRPGEIVKALKRFAANPDLLDGFEPPEEPPDEL